MNKNDVLLLEMLEREHKFLHAITHYEGNGYERSFKKCSFLARAIKAIRWQITPDAVQWHSERSQIGLK